MRHKLALVALAFSATNPADAGTSHCAGDEDVVFSCRIAKSSKVASICASRDLQRDRKNGYLVYRFGAPGRIEFEYPLTRKKSPQKFSYYHYFRPGTDRFALSFSNGRYQYSVYSSYEETETPTDSVGIRVSGGGRSTSADFACASEALQHWYRINGAVPCDEDDMNTCENKKDL
ncbi:hypothetical protein AZKH_1253 [Azoarcus sp. KH32C]|nr:hypothetical protein AZKH_1253 [Azoarcus sp. KH32C]